MIRLLTRTVVLAIIVALASRLTGGEGRPARRHPDASRPPANEGPRPPARAATLPPAVEVDTADHAADTHLARAVECALRGCPSRAPAGDYCRAHRESGDAIAYLEGIR